MNENNETNDFVKRYCTKLNLNEQAYLKSIEIINNINKLQIATNHQPPSVAAASILLMADLMNLEVSKKDLHSHFKISEVTIAKTYKKIHNWIRIVSDSKITNEYIKEMELSLLDKMD
jgi:transcription initiation factor TFIIIB Brf1 subunit/transcription initiation factor TFIIB